MKDQITDLIAAIKQEGISSALESDSFEEILTKGASLILDGAAASIAGAIIGAVAPRLNGIYLSYKQFRFERNIIMVLDGLTKRLTDLEYNYLHLNEDMQEKYRGLYVEMLLDNVIDERQEEKIQWNVNGFVNLMNNESNENIMQIFFNTLEELTVLDVDTLRLYSSVSDINWRDIEIRYGINSERLELVKEKLVRLGLLYRKNDKQRETNIDEIVDYLKKLEADSRKKEPPSFPGIKLSNKIKKVSRLDSYRITSLGKDFLKSIDESDGFGKV